MELENLQFYNIHAPPKVDFRGSFLKERHTSLYVKHCCEIYVITVHIGNLRGSSLGVWGISFKKCPKNIR